MDTPRIKLLEEHLSEAGIEALVQLVDERIQQHSVTKAEYHQILHRFDRVESRIENIDQRLESLEKDSVLLRGELNTFRSDMDARIDRLHERMERMSGEFNARINQVGSELNERINQMSRELNGRMDQLNNRIDSMAKWTVGTIALFGTIISVLITVFKFF